jgi:hypothetical protein
MANATDVIFPSAVAQEQSRDNDSIEDKTAANTEANKSSRSLSRLQGDSSEDDVSIPATYEEIYAISNKNKLRGKEKRRHSQSNVAVNQTQSQPGGQSQQQGSQVLPPQSSMHPLHVSTDEDDDGEEGKASGNQLHSPEADALVNQLFGGGKGHGPKFSDATSGSTMEFMQSIGWVGDDVDEAMIMSETSSVSDDVSLTHAQQHGHAHAHGPLQAHSHGHGHNHSQSVLGQQGHHHQVGFGQPHGHQAQQHGQRYAAGGPGNIRSSGVQSGNKVSAGPHVNLGQHTGAHPGTYAGIHGGSKHIDMSKGAKASTAGTVMRVTINFPLRYNY